MRNRAMSLVFGALLLAACGSCDPDETATDAGTPDAGTDAGADAGADASQAGSCPVTPFDGTVNEWAVSVDTSGRWTLTAPDESHQIVGLPSCDAAAPPIRIGTGDPSVRAAFGSFDIDATEIEWTEVDGEMIAVQDGEDVVLTWVDANTSLVFRPGDHGSVMVELQGPVDATAGEFGWTCAQGDSFFGLGAQVAGMDLRGRTYPMWVEEQGNGKFEPDASYAFPLANQIEAAYAPMGVLWGSAGYTGLIGHDAYSEFDLCNTDDPIASDDAVRLRSYPLQPSIAFVPGATPAERLTRVTDFTGRLPNRPPDWVFGFWVNAVEGNERVEEVATSMRTNGVPVSAIWTEDWAGSAATATGFRLTYEWTWDPGTYPELPRTIDDLNVRGFAFLGYFNPFVPQNVSHYDEGAQMGYLVEDDTGEIILFADPAFRQTTLVDLTQPDAQEWVNGFQTTAIEEVGLNGWMADFAEWWPLEAVPTGADSSWLYHNLYPLDWQRTNRTSFEESNADEWVYFARSGWASVNGGSSGIAPTMWAGDQATNWERYDGFPSIAPIGAHLGLAGIALYGSDIAGYSPIGADNTTKELYYRWAAAGALHPLMRTHHGGDACDNWTFDSDLETIEHTRRWASIHARLFPYFSGRLDEALTVGWPVTRHPYLVAPDAPWMWADAHYEWFIGDDILVAPVWEEGATTRVVSFPSRGWWPMLGTEPLDPTETDEAIEMEVDAPVTELPVFVRPGRGLVLLESAVDTFFGAQDPSVSTLADVDGRYTIALYPDEQGEVFARDAGIQLNAQAVNSLSTFENALVDGDPIPQCAAGVTGSCWETDRLVLVDVTEVDVAADNATYAITSDSPVRVTLQIGGRAFGALADVPAEPNLASDPPTWCERHEN